MSGAAWKWSPERVDALAQALQGARTLDEGLRAAGQALGMHVSRAAADEILKRYGRGTAFSNLQGSGHLARPVVVPVVKPAPATQASGPAISIAKPVPAPPSSAPRVEAATVEAPPEPPPAVTTAAEILAHRQRTKIAELEARTKRLVAELSAKDEELASFKEIARPPRPIDKPTRQPQDKQRKGVPVLLCSDWHVGETVDPAKVNGLNEYTPEIAARCIDRLADGFEWMLRDARFDCRSAVIGLLGDMMTGYIHAELAESNALSPVEEQVFLLDHLEAMFRKILATTNLERIVVPCLSGNHGRMTEKQRVSTREENSHEQVVYQTLARLFRGEPRIEFHIAQGEWLEVDCMGFTLAMTHGDSFMYGGGVGGMTIPIRRGIARQFQGRDVHQFCMGHFHKRTDDGDIQINGSLIGYSSYSQRIHAAYAPREQAWFLMDSERGKSISAPIWV